MTSLDGFALELPNDLSTSFVLESCGGGFFRGIRPGGIRIEEGNAYGVYRLFSFGVREGPGAEVGISRIND